MDTTTEQFLRSVGNAFAENGLGARGAVLLLVGAGVVLGIAVSSVVRRALARRESLARFAAAHGLGPEELRLARALASRAGIAPLDLLHRIDLFERATARALADAPAGGAEDPAAGIARLRQALRFDRLPAHAPLLSTRELARGTAFETDVAGPRRGVVLSADERALQVELDGAVAVPPGVELVLTLPHARDVPHAVRCRVLELGEPSGAAARLALSHDEAPERHQHRAYARVAAEGDVAVRALIWPVTPPGARLQVTARLLDASAGGLHVASPVPLPVGLLAEVRFRLAQAEFEGLRAVVLSCDRGAKGGHEARLELRGLPAAERDRLAAAVGRAEAWRRERG